MRIELQEEDKKGTEEREEENKKDDLRNRYESDLTRKEKLLLEKQKLAEMTLGGKLQYIWAYYRAAIAGVIAVIALIFVIADIYDNSKVETLLSIQVIDSSGIGQEETTLELEAFFSAEDNQYQQVELAENLQTTEDGTELGAYDQMAFVTKINAQAIDILIMPQPFCKSMAADDYLASMEEVFGKEGCEALGIDAGDLYLEVEDQELAEKFGVSYEPVCIGVVVNTTNMENAGTWLTSIM